MDAVEVEQLVIGDQIADDAEERERKPEEQRHAAQPRLGLRVHPAVVDLVDHADLGSQARHQRRRERRRARREDERHDQREGIHAERPAVSRLANAMIATPASASNSAAIGSG